MKKCQKDSKQRESRKSLPYAREFLGVNGSTVRSLEGLTSCSVILSRTICVISET